MIDKNTRSQQDESPWGTEDWLREFADIFFLRIRVILGSALLVFFGAVLVAFFWPRTYQAQAHLLVGARTPEMSTGVARPRQELYPVEEAHVISEIEILRSPSLIERTVQAMKKQDGVKESSQERKMLAQAVRQNRSQLEASVIPSSHVIRITYYSDDPEQAERFLDTHLENYMSYRNQVFSTPEESTFLRKRAEEYRTRLQEINEQIVQKTAEAGNVALIDEELSNNTDLQKELRARLADLRGDYARQQEEIKAIEDPLDNEDVQFFAFLDNESIDRLGERLATLIEKREQVAQEYQPESRRQRDINEIVDNMYGKLRLEAINIYEERRRKMEGTGATIKSLEKSLRELGERNVELNKRAVEIRRLQNTADMLKSSYQVFSGKMEEAEINSAVAEAQISGDVNILNKAASTAEVAYPKTLPTLLIGLLAALVFGFTLAFVTEYLDQSIHRVSEVNRFLDLPVLYSLSDIE